MVGICLDSLCGNNNSPTEHLSYLRLALGQELKFLTVLLVQIKEYFLVACYQKELFLVNLQNSVLIWLLVVVAELFFHDKFKLIVVNGEGVFTLDQNRISKRIQWGEADFKLMDFLKAVLGWWVDWVNWELFVCYNVHFVFIGHLDFLDFSVQVVVTNLLGVKVKKTDLCLGWTLVFIAENWVDFFRLWVLGQCNCYNSIKWV